DLTPHAGALVLRHSHAGRERISAGGRDLWRTRPELPDPRTRTSHLLSEPGRPGRPPLAGSPPPAPGPPPGLPPPQPPPPPPADHDNERPSRWQRFLDKIKEWFR